MENDHIEHFWKWFTRCHEQLLTSPVGNISEEEFWQTEIRLHLQAIEPEIDMEIWRVLETNEHWLIITARGYAELFPTIDAIVEQAPYTKGWTFQALYPPMQPDFRLEGRYDLSKFNPLDLSFNPVDIDWEDTEGLFIAYTPDYKEIGKEEEDATWELLFNLVGERQIGARFCELFLMPVKEAPEEIIAGMRPIIELPSCFPAEDSSGLSVNGEGTISKEKAA